jgi:hypothetical protein
MDNGKLKLQENIQNFLTCKRQTNTILEAKYKDKHLKKNKSRTFRKSYVCFKIKLKNHYTKRYKTHFKKNHKISFKGSKMMEQQKNQGYFKNLSKFLANIILNNIYMTSV